MSKPYFVWRDYKGKHQCLALSRWYATSGLVVAWFDHYGAGVAYARQANIDEAGMQRVAKQQRAIAESRQRELAI